MNTSRSCHACDTADGTEGSGAGGGSGVTEQHPHPSLQGGVCCSGAGGQRPAGPVNTGHLVWRRYRPPQRARPPALAQPSLCSSAEEQRSSEPRAGSSNLSRGAVAVEQRSLARLWLWFPMGTAGSIPVGHPTLHHPIAAIAGHTLAAVAQLEERPVEARKVSGSNPDGSTHHRPIPV